MAVMWSKNLTHFDSLGYVAYATPHTSIKQFYLWTTNQSHTGSLYLCGSCMRSRQENKTVQLTRLLSQG